MSAEVERLRFVASDTGGEVSALLLRPPEARALLVLAHGAGAGMEHPVMEATARQLGSQRIATFRYQFPSMEKGKRRPDSKPTAVATVRSAVAEAGRIAPDLPLLAGGKSFGGRMTSLAAAEAALPGVRGLVFVGFPLHPAGRPGTQRADHLRLVGIPMLFLQGTRDKLADLELLRPLCEDLPGATLHVIADADHSFHVLKRSGRNDAEVLDELARATASWLERLP